MNSRTRVLGVMRSMVHKPKRNKKHQDVSKYEQVDSLSAMEEIIFRSINGISLSKDVPLKRKSTDPQLLSRLLEIELAIIERSRIRNNSKK
jgi:hypothetical protein